MPDQIDHFATEFVADHVPTDVPNAMGAHLAAGVRALVRDAVEAAQRERDEARHQRDRATELMGHAHATAVQCAAETSRIERERDEAKAALTEAERTLRAVLSTVTVPPAVAPMGDQAPVTPLTAKEETEIRTTAALDEPDVPADVAIRRLLATLDRERDEAKAALAEARTKIDAYRAVWEEAVRHQTAMFEAERKLREVSEQWTKTDAELRHANAKLSAMRAGPDDVWFWQGRGDDPASLTCPVVMLPETLRAILGPAQGAGPGKGGKIVWGWATSDEAESWQGSFTTREEAVAEAVAHAEPCEAIFVLRGRYPKPSEHVPHAGTVCADMEEAVADIIGGWDDAVFEVRDDKAAEEALKAWADTHVAVLAWGADGDGKPELARASTGREVAS